MKKDKLWTNIAMGVFLMFVCFGCAVYEPLEGLCYTDKRGTFICMEEEGQPEIIRELEEEIELLIDPKIDLDDPWEECKGFEGTEQWHWCIQHRRIA
tara:strand:+ start:703 stop:993 length:291 start_codon:yes stop_codon:yes gene_type:complete